MTRAGDVTTEQGASSAREDVSICGDCGGENPVWFAPNAVPDTNGTSA